MSCRQSFNAGEKHSLVKRKRQSRDDSAFSVRYLYAVYFFILFFLKLISPIIPILKKSMSPVVTEMPSFRAIQLIPTTGNKLTRTMVLRWSCFAMKSAIGGEYV